MESKVSWVVAARLSEILNLVHDQEQVLSAQVAGNHSF